MKIQNKIPVRIHKITLAPLDPVPVSRQHLLVFQLALEMFGKLHAEGRRLSKGALQGVIDRLKAIRDEHLSKNLWDRTLEGQAKRAYEATRQGDNHLYRYHSQTEGDFYVFRI